MVVKVKTHQVHFAVHNYFVIFINLQFFINYPKGVIASPLIKVLVM